MAQRLQKVEFKYDFNNGINSIKMQKYMIRMTFLSTILFAVHRLEFTTDHPREKIIIPEIYKD